MLIHTTWNTKESSHDPTYAPNERSKNCQPNNQIAHGFRKFAAPLFRCFIDRGFLISCSHSETLFHLFFVGGNFGSVRFRAPRNTVCICLIGNEFNFFFIFKCHRLKTDRHTDFLAARNSVIKVNSVAITWTASVSLSDRSIWGGGRESAANCRRLRPGAQQPPSAAPKLPHPTGPGDLHVSSCPFLHSSTGSPPKPTRP